MKSSHLIYLIGLPGSGKSSVGKVLSEKLGYKFIDLDEYIEKHENRSIKEIFEEKGEGYFRDLESDSIEILSGEVGSGTIIATGGGTPCFNNNLELLKSKGLVIYLKADIEELIRRIESNLSEKETRPLFISADIKSKYKSLIDDRAPYYNEAHLIVDTAGYQKNEIADLILSEINR